MGMTLVRKGLIEARHYHLVYGFTLFIMFPAMVVTLHCMDGITQLGTLRALLATMVAVSLRMPDFEVRLLKGIFGNGKYLVWCLSVLAGPVLEWIVTTVFGEYMPFVAWFGMLWSLGDTLTKLIAPAALSVC